MNGKNSICGSIIARFDSPFVAVPPLCMPRYPTWRSFFGNISHLPLHNRLTIKICFLLSVDFSQSINFRFSIYRSRWEEEKTFNFVHSIKQANQTKAFFTTLFYNRSIHRKKIYYQPLRDCTALSDWEVKHLCNHLWIVSIAIWLRHRHRRIII